MRKALPWVYLALALLGAILPWKANLEFIAESGGQVFDLARFVADANSTAASRSLSADLLIGASAVTLWICVDCLLYTSPSPRDYAASRMPSSA